MVLALDNPLRLYAIKQRNQINLQLNNNFPRFLFTPKVINQMFHIPEITIINEIPHNMEITIINQILYITEKNSNQPNYNQSNSLYNGDNYNQPNYKQPNSQYNRDNYEILIPSFYISINIMMDRCYNTYPRNSCVDLFFMLPRRLGL